MKRRDFMKGISGTFAAMTLVPYDVFLSFLNQDKKADSKKALQRIAKLKGEKAAQAVVKSKRGGPRLFLNQKEIYPFFALSTHMYPTLKNFQKAGIHIYHPIIGIRSGWLGPDHYDWSQIDVFLGHLLELNPKSFFLPRVQLNTPTWWKKSYPEDLIQYGLEAPEDKFNLIEKKNLKPSEGGFYFRASNELWEASFASEKWRKDTSAALRDFALHIENSPLKSRMIGYMPTTGRTAEWNTFGPDYLPDYSQPMKKACGEVPDAEERLKTFFGLLRDPQKEKKVIRFYQKYHQTISDTALLMCRTLKQATQGRCLVGVFYGYLLEQVRIQEGGYLAMQKFLESPDVDYIAGPYTYMPGNVRDKNGIRFTTQDGAGNILGNARGVAGDGGYRLMTESLRRHGKLYFSEMDPSTYLEKNPHKVIGGHGGEGSGTQKGSLQILRRDLGQMFASGAGGWLFDFGPLNQAEKGWYSSPDIIREIKRFNRLGEKRRELDISPVSEIAAVCDDRSFSATQHWLEAKPWKNYAIKATDFFNHWFLNSQARAFHRMGAPMDFLYLGDLCPDDMKRYRLIFMVNVFMMDDDQVDRICQMLNNSGVTVVWFYAPGFITPDKLSLDRMEELTRFHFHMVKKPGPMLINLNTDLASLSGIKKFGTDGDHWPRFILHEDANKVWGTWDDLKQAALGSKEYNGFTSVYTGTAPLPSPLLRWLAKNFQVRLWSTEPDIVRATRDAAMLVATHSGQRVFTLHKPLRPVQGGESKKSHKLNMEKGEVRLFL